MADCYHITCDSVGTRVALQRALAGKIKRFAGHDQGKTLAVIVGKKGDLEKVLADVFAGNSFEGASFEVSSKAEPLADLAAEDKAVAIKSIGKKGK